MKNDKNKKEQEEKNEEEHEERIDEDTSMARDEVEQEIEKLKQRTEELENSYKRALADYQNLQKRVAEDKQNWIKFSNNEVLLRLLPVLDALFLANKHKETTELKMIIQQFLDALKAEGVTRIETKEKTFDPQFMEAITLAEGAEGKVIEEARAGFMIHDKLLRPAQAIVGGILEKN